MNNRIKAIRKDQEMTQEEFSSKIDLSRNFIAQIESGLKAPSDRTVRDICRVFNISENWLRTGEGEMYMPEMDEDAAYVSDLLEDTDDTVYQIIKGIMKTYRSLGEKEKETLRNFAQDFLDNMKDGG